MSRHVTASTRDWDDQLEQLERHAEMSMPWVLEAIRWLVDSRSDLKTTTS
ncbi:hypothetical protein BH23ACT5_BH23ACT5_10510 [soil metagenome]